jgi:hypothetical protein
MLMHPTTKTGMTMMTTRRTAVSGRVVSHCSHSNVSFSTFITILSANMTVAHETGEEGETTVWTGRAKLYTMTGEGTTKAWKERGVGTFKFNISDEEPKKARFVLRADGTHRLLLNAAVTKQLVFGGDSSGEKPKEGRLLFNSPTADGELEMHLLKVCCYNQKYVILRSSANED